jgi:chromosome segregation ATPase
MSSNWLFAISKHLPKLEQELFEWEDKYKKCQSVDNLKKRLNGLMGEYTWSSVIEVEKTLESLEKDRRGNQKNRDKTGEKLDEAKAKQADSHDQIGRMKAVIESLKAVIDAKAAERGLLGLMACWCPV